MQIRSGVDGTFQKRPAVAAEGAAVFGVVQRVALSHPEVSVKFIRDGKQELLTMLCMALNGNIRGLAVALDAIREKKEGEAA